MTIDARLFEPAGHYLDPSLIQAAFLWTEQQPEHKKLIVIHAKKTLATPTLERINRRYGYPATTPSTNHRDGRPFAPTSVLAIWPDVASMDLAIDLANDGSLAVLSHPNHDISGHLDKLGLAGPPAINPAAANILDRTIESCEHNGLIGTPDKEMTIRALRQILTTPTPPTPDEIRQYALSQGVSSNSAATLRTYAQEILQGKKHLDYRRKPI